MQLQFRVEASGDIFDQLSEAQGTAVIAKELRPARSNERPTFRFGDEVPTDRSNAAENVLPANDVPVGTDVSFQEISNQLDVPRAGQGQLDSCLLLRIVRGDVLAEEKLEASAIAEPNARAVDDAPLIRSDAVVRRRIEPLLEQLLSPLSAVVEVGATGHGDDHLAMESVEPLVARRTILPAEFVVDRNEQIDGVGTKAFVEIKTGTTRGNHLLDVRKTSENAFPDDVRLFGVTVFQQFEDQRGAKDV